MQNKLVIAALIGATSARDYMSLKHAVVQAAQGGFDQQLHQAIDQGLDQAQGALADAEDIVDDLNEAAVDILETLREEIASDYLPQERSAVDAKKLEDIVGGILKGALDAEGFTDINSCIADAEEVFQDAEAAFKDFEAKDTKHMIDGIEKIADILKTIKSGMKDCSSIKADWKKLENMIAIFSSPSSFAYHVGKDLMVNGVDIFHEISDAVHAYNNQDWTKFGIDIGEATAKTLIGEESLEQLGSTPDQIKLAQIEQGIFKAFGGNFNLLALLSCIGDEDKALLVFDSAVQQFQAAYKDKSPQDAIGGIILAIAGVKQAQAGLPACEAIDTTTFNFEQLQSTYEIAAHPLEHFKALEEDLLINGVSIKKNGRMAMKSWRKNDFVSFGYYLGSILEAATRTETPVEEKEQDRELVMNRNMVAEVAQGFLESTQVGTFNFTNLLICIYEADQASLVLYQAVDLLEKAYKDKDPNEAIGGVIATVAFVQGLKQTIPVCESVDQSSMDWTHFDNILDVVESPEKHMTVIGEDIVMNDVEITEELSQALDSFRSENFKDFGFQLGQVLYLATENPQNLFLY